MFTFETRVRYSECNQKGEASVTAILDYLQDCCTFQSEDLSIGVEYLNRMNAFWVLTDWQVDILRYPKLAEKISVGTIPYEIKGLFGLRNFLITDAKGEELVKANSVWALLDKTTGKPVRAPEELCKAYPVKGKLNMEYLPRKLPRITDAELVSELTVPHYFLDTNRHVNNAKYIMIGEELLDEDFVTERVWAEYRHAAVLSDHISINKRTMENGVYCSLTNENGQEYANIIFFGGRK